MTAATRVSFSRRDNCTRRSAPGTAPDRMVEVIRQQLAAVVQR